MAVRVKHEVSTARTRLDATLQSLVDKKEDSFEDTAESDDENDIPLPISVQVVRSSGSPAVSPAKRPVRSKKRKRKDESANTSVNSSTGPNSSYMMKLFDRSVDLAKFADTTPLYPIARAWINSQAHPDNTELFKEDVQSLEEEDPNNPFVYSLPSPMKLKFEYGNDRDSRIPDLIPSDDLPLDINADPDLGPPPEELLLKHMDRWKRIRNSWCTAARYNEQKYSESMTVLKDMYERNLNYD